MLTLVRLTFSMHLRTWSHLILWIIQIIYWVCRKVDVFLTNFGIIVWTGNIFEILKSQKVALKLIKFLQIFTKQHSELWNIKHKSALSVNRLQFVFANNATTEPPYLLGWRKSINTMFMHHYVFLLVFLKEMSLDNRFLFTFPNTWQLLFFWQISVFSLVCLIISSVHLHYAFHFISFPESLWQNVTDLHFFIPFMEYF